MVVKGYRLCPAANQNCLEALLVPSSLCVISESMASRCSEDAGPTFPLVKEL